MAIIEGGGGYKGGSRKPAFSNPRMPSPSSTAKSKPKAPAPAPTFTSSKPKAPSKPYTGGPAGVRPMPIQKPKAPAKPPAPASTPAPAPAPEQRMGYDFGAMTAPLSSGDFVDSTLVAATPAPVVKPPSEEDYLAGDSIYNTEVSALQSALERYLADADFQRGTYATDYASSLRDLGYDEGNKKWNWDDSLTASGRGYQSQVNDFAARGMLQSQGYADAFQELQRMLGQQYDSLQGARNNFETDLNNQIANFKGENTSASQAARAEALARRAAQFSL